MSPRKFTPKEIALMVISTAILMLGLGFVVNHNSRLVTSVALLDDEAKDQNAEVATIESEQEQQQADLDKQETASTEKTKEQKGQDAKKEPESKEKIENNQEKPASDIPSSQDSPKTDSLVTNQDALATNDSQLDPQPEAAITEDTIANPEAQLASEAEEQQVEDSDSSSEKNAAETDSDLINPDQHESQEADSSLEAANKDLESELKDPPEAVETSDADSDQLKDQDSNEESLEEQAQKHDQEPQATINQASTESNEADSAQVAKNTPEFLLPNCTYNTTGSQNITNQEVDEVLEAEVATNFPEKVEINPDLINLDRDPNLHFSQDANVTITFIDEGAGYKNTFGYFVYQDQNLNGQISKDEIIAECVIFASSSKKGSGGQLQAGDTVDLGSFPKGVSLGFYLVADGYNKAIDTYYTIDNFNKGHRPHIAMLLTKDSQNIILGLEDQDLGDRDYNDVLFRVSSATPGFIESAARESNLAQSGSDTSFSFCGNKQLEPGEDCDDGNDSNLDGCTNECEIGLVEVPLHTCAGDGEAYLFTGDQFQEISHEFTVQRDQVLIFTKLTDLLVKVDGQLTQPTPIKSVTQPFKVHAYKIQTNPGSQVEVYADSKYGARDIQGFLAQDQDQPIYNPDLFQVVYDGELSNQMYLQADSYDYLILDKYTYKNNRTHLDERKLKVNLKAASGSEVYSKEFRNPFPQNIEGAVVDSIEIAEVGNYDFAISTEDSVYWMLVNCEDPALTSINEEVTQEVDPEQDNTSRASDSDVNNIESVTEEQTPIAETPDEIVDQDNSNLDEPNVNDNSADLELPEKKQQDTSKELQEEAVLSSGGSSASPQPKKTATSNGSRSGSSGGGGSAPKLNKTLNLPATNQANNQPSISNNKDLAAKRIKEETDLKLSREASNNNLSEEQEEAELATTIELKDQKITLEEYVKLYPLMSFERSNNDYNRMISIPRSGQVSDRLLEEYEANKLFTDVDVNHPHYRAAASLYLQEVINGDTNGLIHIDDPVSRAEAVKIILRSAERKIPRNYEAYFPDTSKNSWYQPFVNYAYHADILKGYQDGNFYPANKLTQKQAILIIGRTFATELSVTKPDFKYYLAQLKARNLLPATISASSDFNQQITRGQVFEIIYRITKMIDSGEQNYVDSFTFSVPKLGLNQVPVHRTLVSQPTVWLSDLMSGAGFYEDIREGRKGNLLIFAHSSDYKWNNNPYGTIFKPLIKGLDVGDEVEVYQNGKLQKYQITAKDLIDDSQINYIENSASDVDLIIFTCDLDITKRWIFKAQSL
jgi:cysteine-rich repeat protein